MIRKIAKYAGVLTLGFLVGLFVDFMFSVRVERRESRPTSAVGTRIDEWHRLYEAAGMTGDSEIIKQVNDRLFCANDAGQSNGVLLTLDQWMFCRTSAGDVQLTSVSGSFGEFIKKSHLSWSLQNSDFVASVANPEAAREYVRQHQTP
jgi:hypothetical protein